VDLSFERNLGIWDRIIRFVIGAILLYLVTFSPVVMSVWVSIVLGILGLAMIIEGMLAY